MSKDKVSSKSKSSSKSDRGSASVFFFKWTASTLDAYTKSIKSNYLKVLVAHCTRAREGDEEGSKNFDYSELGSNPRVVKDDREDIRRRLRDAKTRVWTNEEAKPETPISLAELSAIYRLKTLTKMCEKLSEIMGRMVKWFENNRKAFHKVADMDQIFEYIRRMFESACAMGEVFLLTSVNWKSCKFAKLLNPSEKEYVRSEDERLEIQPLAQSYCPKFMSQINYYRTLVYTLGCSFEGVLETLFITVNQERCEVRQKEITMVLQQLPPQYLFTKDTLEFSRRTANLLSTPPKNAFSFPTPLQDMSENSKKESDRILANSNRKSAKISSSKYYHGRTGEGKSGKSEKKSNKSNKSLRSEPTQPSDKSKSKSKSKSEKKSIIKKVLSKGSNSKRSEKE